MLPFANRISAESGQLLLGFGQLLLASTLRITTISRGLAFSQTCLTRRKLKPLLCPERAASARVTCDGQFNECQLHSRQHVCAGGHMLSMLWAWLQVLQRDG